MKKILNILTAVALLSSVSLSGFAQTVTSECKQGCPPVKTECPKPCPMPPKEECPAPKVESPAPCPAPKEECPPAKVECPKPCPTTQPEKKKKSMFQKLNPYKK